MLAAVDVPESAGRGRPSGARARLRRILGTDRPWHLPPVPASADRASRDLRYRRVLTRLPPGPDGVRRLLVLVAEDDPAAQRAVARFGAVAAAERAPVELTVAEVTAAQPIVPDGRGGVLVVLSLGSRGAWELVAMARACADAGHEVLGVVLTRAVRVRGKLREEPADADPPQAPAVRDVMAGSV